MKGVGSPGFMRWLLGWPGDHSMGEGEWWIWNPVPLKLSSLTEFIINLSIQNFIPFLVPSNLNPLLTILMNQSQMTKTAIADNIFNVLEVLL